MIKGGMKAGVLAMLLAVTAAAQAPARPAAKPQQPAQPAPQPARPAQQAPVRTPTPGEQGKAPDEVYYGKPLFPTAKPEKAQFRMEYVYNFTRMPYQPAVIITPVKPANATYSTPEEAFISQFSAMLAGDFDAWLGGWSAESQKTIQERNRTMGRGPAFWRQVWERSLKGKQINLVERLESGLYVMLVYTLTVPAEGNREDFRSMQVFRKKENKWEATMDLAEDKLFHHYSEGQPRVSREGTVQPAGPVTPGQSRSQGDVAQAQFVEAYPLGRKQIVHVVR